jgi:hypothetical protein
MLHDPLLDLGFLRRECSACTSNGNFATHLSVSVLQPRSIKRLYADTLEVNAS